MSPTNVILIPRLIGENVVFLSQVFQNKMVIPEFEDFCGQVTEIFESCRENESGKVADYIPQLAKYREGEKSGPRLRDPAAWLPLAIGASSRNLGSIFLTIPVQPRHLGLLRVHRRRPEVLAGRHGRPLHAAVVQQALHLRHRHERAGRGRGAQVRGPRAQRPQLQRDLPGRPEQAVQSHAQLGGYHDRQLRDDPHMTSVNP